MNLVLPAVLGAGVVPPAILAIRHREVGFLDATEHLGIQAVAKPACRFEHGLRVGVFRLEVANDFRIGLVPEPRVIVAEGFAVTNHGHGLAVRSWRSRHRGGVGIHCGGRETEKGEGRREKGEGRLFPTPFSLAVEAQGIEPWSESASGTASTCVGSASSLASDRHGTSLPDVDLLRSRSRRRRTAGHQSGFSIRCKRPGRAPVIGGAASEPKGSTYAASARSELAGKSFPKGLSRTSDLGTRRSLLPT